VTPYERKRAEMMMAYFSLFADESGKLDGKNDYTSFCGYVTHLAEWENISLEWNTLRCSWDVPPIHMRCAMFPDRENCDEWLRVKHKWGVSWEAKRDDMLLEFGRIIANSHSVAVGSVVDSAYFKSLPDSPFKRGIDNPLYISLVCDRGKFKKD
jgi:hypothetical protein